MVCLSDFTNREQYYFGRFVVIISANHSFGFFSLFVLSRLSSPHYCHYFTTKLRRRQTKDDFLICIFWLLRGFSPVFFSFLLSNLHSPFFGFQLIFFPVAYPSSFPPYVFPLLSCTHPVPSFNSNLLPILSGVKKSSDYHVLK